MGGPPSREEPSTVQAGRDHHPDRPSRASGEFSAAGAAGRAPPSLRRQRRNVLLILIVGRSHLDCRAAGTSSFAARWARRARSNTASRMPRPRHRCKAWPRCRDSAAGLSVPSKVPKASAAWPIIRRLAGEPGTTTMVMLAMLFIAEQRAANQPGLALLSPRDIVEVLKETLPSKPQGKEALVARINQRHARRRSAIISRFRSQTSAAPS